MAKFRTRARTVDMLGRQQIAGIPTAISELFKNSYDAYATEVTANFVQPSLLFSLRDNGYGMTLQEFERGWLTLGTEAKVTGEHRPPPPGVSQRAILGEKGIGRLAISAIGPQVLILTRGQSETTQPLVMCFIHWGLFEMPGIDLDEIEIPIRLRQELTLPSRDDVATLIQDFNNTVQRLRSRMAPGLASRINKDLADFDVDPSLADEHHPGPSLARGSVGTHFYIKPTDESLTALLGDSTGIRGSSLVKMLIGFTNTLTPDHQRPAVEAHFYHHRAVDDLEDIIEEKEFFTPEDFENADHNIVGTFDVYGQFEGDIRVFGEAPVRHTVVWRDARGNPTACGPFRIAVAYIQGAFRQSRLSQEDFVRMDHKLERASGLYVYRDGIRVLPYGNNEYDFLNIEERRTRHAAYYYFSYRRMFGAIELTSAANKELQEKAGREGFRENGAYRQFRAILEHFFVQIAADFFREGGTYAEQFVERRTELELQDRARQRRDRLLAVKRNAFRTQMEAVLHRIDSGGPVKDAEEAKKLFNRGLAQAKAQPDSAKATEILLDAELAGRSRLQDIKNDYRVTKPRGVGLGRPLVREWDAYQAEYARLQQEVFPQLDREFEDAVAAGAAEVGTVLDVRRRLERSIEETTKSARSETARGARAVREALAHLDTAVRRVVGKSTEDVDRTILAADRNVASLDTATLSADQVIEIRSSIEDEVDRIARLATEVLARIEDRLRELSNNVSAQAASLDEPDVEAAVDEELIALRERSEIDLELAALGMAVEVINHEFDSTLRAVRNYLKRLKRWADTNVPLQRLYEGLAASFDHLDAYLTLFTPLQRRAQRRKIEIKGVDVVMFLRDLFRQRFKEEEVTLQASDEFHHRVIVGYPSAFYPVFVNLVDNALFWLREVNTPRTIALNVDGQDLLVSDNGPGIKERDRQAVFELGFTRKPGGRGLGLHISKELLSKVGWDLSVDAGNGGGAVFRIAPQPPDDPEEERIEP